MKLLAVAAQERHYLYPNVPTMKEQKVNLEMGNWVGLAAPKGVSEEVIAKLDRAIKKAVMSPEVSRPGGKSGTSQVTRAPRITQSGWYPIPPKPVNWWRT